jgi:hypothetical protein
MNAARMNPGNRDDEKHPAPRRNHRKQLRADNRAKAEPEQGEQAEHESLVKPPPLRCRRLAPGSDAAGDIRTFHHAHNRPNDDQAEKPGGQCRQAGKQRKKHNGRQQNLPPADPVRQAAHEYRGNAPSDAENTDDGAELLVVEMQVLHHERKQRRDHPAVQPN